jgi:hypothetical protein
VSGAGSVLQTTLYDLNVGNSGGPFSSLVVSNGGQVLVYRTTYIGSATSGNNSILVGPGGLLEMGVGNYGDALIIGSAAGNTISNSGGVFQFKASAFNNINNGGNSANISITDGTVSFCGITDADVGVSAPGGKLNNTVMTWSGANTFMLNNATNKSSGQAYTFQPGNPTNFARLALLNGSLYRGGTATFGSGGVLMVTNGAAAITNVVLQAGATLAVHLKATNDYSQLTALGTVDVTGSTLAVSLGAAPDRDGFEYVIIRKNTAGGVTGTFANSTVIPTFGGREYPLRVNYAGGDGNDVSLVYRAPGTVFTIR